MIRLYYTDSGVPTFEQDELINVRHSLVDQEIHLFSALNTSGDVVQEYFEMVGHLYDNPPESQLLLLVLDMRPGMPPLRDIYSQTRRFFARKRDLPPNRAAYLFEDNSQLTLMSSFLTFLSFMRLRNTTRRIFVGDKLDEAVAWLREENELYMARQNAREVQPQ